MVPVAGAGGSGAPGVVEVDPVEDCPGSGVVGGILVLILNLDSVGNSIVTG
jgi:hypothetical protein